jgi:hypothetical protein
VEILLSERTLVRLKQRTLELTPRNWGRSLQACIAQVNAYLKGWFGFFGVLTAREPEDLGLGGLDAHIPAPAPGDPAQALEAQVHQGAKTHRSGGSFQNGVARDV